VRRSHPKSGHGPFRDCGATVRDDEMPIKTNRRMSDALSSILAVFLSLFCTSVSQAQNNASVSGNPTGSATHGVTVADAIEMTRTGDNDYLSSWDKSGNVALFSPNGAKFAFVTQKGDLKRDVNEYSIRVFDTASALTSPSARIVATLASSSNRPAISQLKWLPDNDTLVFLGEQPNEIPQIFKVRVSTGKLEKLTKQAIPITGFSASDGGDAFIFSARATAGQVFSDEQLRRGFFVTSGHRWEELYLNRRQFDLQHEIYIQTSSMNRAQQVGAVQQTPWNDSLSISPNGAYALLSVFNTDPPAVWDDYEFKSDGDLSYQRSACLAKEVRRCAEQFWLVDLRKKTIKPLLNAPTVHKEGGRSLAAWTKNNTVLLVNTLLPLDSAQGEELQRRRRNVYVAEVKPATGEIHQIEERGKILPADSMEFDRNSDRFVATPESGTLTPPLEFREQGGKWKVSEISAGAASLNLPLSVTLQEDIHSPPKLMAADPKTKNKIMLLDLNPQFAQLAFGRVEVIHWKTRDAQPAGGELYYPTGYETGTRYPLVIQTHAESRERFWIDGPFSTANAAQALANKGFFVLQMGFGDRYDETAFQEIVRVYNTPQEGPLFTSFVEAAIDELDHRGLIDRNRVGISGFSRTVFQGEYVLTHSKYPIGAAVMADGVDFGYVGCIYYFAPSLGSLCEKINVGLPWGDTLPNWVKESPPMRLDKIRAPLLLQAITAPLGEWEIYAGLQWMKKPVDLVNFYPEGEHELVRPQQKYLSEQSAVDWYCFWLKGEEDPDPAKAEQYKRWRELKTLQVANENKSAEASSGMAAFASLRETSHATGL